MKALLVTSLCGWVFVDAVGYLPILTLIRTPSIQQLVRDLVVVQGPPADYATASSLGEPLWRRICIDESFRSHPRQS
jgi:hypothetical protein